MFLHVPCFRPYKQVSALTSCILGSQLWSELNLLSTSWLRLWCLSLQSKLRHPLSLLQWPLDVSPKTCTLLPPFLAQLAVVYIDNLVSLLNTFPGLSPTAGDVSPHPLLSCVKGSQRCPLRSRYKSQEITSATFSVKQSWKRVRDKVGLAGKSTSYSFKEPKFKSQHLHGSSQVLGDLVQYSGLIGHSTYMVHKHTCRQNSHAQKWIIINNDDKRRVGLKDDSC